MLDYVVNFRHISTFSNCNAHRLFLQVSIANITVLIYRHILLKIVQAIAAVRKHGVFVSIFTIFCL